MNGVILKDLFCFHSHSSETFRELRRHRCWNWGLSGACSIKSSTTDELKVHETDWHCWVELVSNWNWIETHATQTEVVCVQSCSGCFFRLPSTLAAPFHPYTTPVQSLSIVTGVQVYNGLPTFDFYLNFLKYSTKWARVCWILNLITHHVFL